MEKFTMVIELTLGRLSVPTFNSYVVGTLLGKYTKSNLRKYELLLF